jgi:glycine betaine/choline ABC-type transport system substrate-binding protein
VFLVRKETEGRVPALEEVLNRLGGALSTDEMRRLNYEVDGNKRTAKDVAREWLQLKGL